MEPQIKEPRHVILYPSDAGGCGLYRLIWPGNALAFRGKAVNVLQKSPKVAVDQFNKVVGINVGTADLVIFQRPGDIQLQQVIQILQENGVRVGIDMDDSLSKIHPRNKAFKAYDPRYSHQKNWMHAQVACDMADFVTVTTQALAEEYGKHGRVSVIPNHVPESYLKVQRPSNEVPVVGWTGWTQTHVYDLTVTGGIINQALIDTGAKFVGFGDDGIFNDLQIRLRPPHEVWSFESINDYPKRLAGFDIGLVPLVKSEFNEAKSWLKGLEYASLGIVPVVTPLGDYINLIDAGMAVPAATPKEWYDRVTELIRDHDYRQEMSEKVRTIAADWTIEGNTHKWWQAWSKDYGKL